MGCGQTHTTHWQVHFPVYLANMLKTMHCDSMDLVHRLESEGTPNAFGSEPVASVKDWSHLQSFDCRTLICTQVCKVSGVVWRKAVESVSEGVLHMQQLLTSLKNVERKVAPSGTVLAHARSGTVLAHSETVESNCRR